MTPAEIAALRCARAIANAAVIQARKAARDAMCTEHLSDEQLVRVLREEIDAIEALPVVRLPVITTCGVCGYLVAMGRPNVKVPRSVKAAELHRYVAFYHCENPRLADDAKDATGVMRMLPESEPPSTCPYRRETP